MIDEAVPKLLELASKHGVWYTFFVTGAVAKSTPNLLEAIKDDGHEIGVHTHPSTHPPLFKGRSLNDLFADRLPIYPYSIQLRMIQEDLNDVRKCVGFQPISFKASCNSINAATLQALETLSFKIDASLWEYHFTPFWMRKKPIPTFFCSSILDRDTSLLEVIGGINEKYIMNIEGFKPAIEKFLSRAMGDVVVLLISFHPMIMADPHLPFKEYLENFTKILKFLKNQGWKILTLSQFLEEMLESGFTNYPLSVKIDWPSKLFLTHGVKERFLFHASRFECTSSLIQRFAQTKSD